MVGFQSMKQLSLISLKKNSDFGGSLNKGKRKSARPLGIKKSNHLVLKAKNSWHLLKNQNRVSEILNQYAKKFGIQIYAFAVHSDHIHICFRIQNRDAYKKWIRAVTSVLVQKIKGLKFGLRPWSRIVDWGKAFRTVLAYIYFNNSEAEVILTAFQTADRFKQKVLTNLKMVTALSPLRAL